MEIMLAIDGGGSRTRCLAIDSNGGILGGGESGPSNHLLVDTTIVRRSLKEAIDQSLVEANIASESVKCISAGLAGVDYQGEGQLEMEALFREIGFESLVIEGDIVIAHAAALGNLPGVVVVAGTGSATLGVSRGGDRIRVGGWGPIFGDEGSAQRIGQMALMAAARSHDGRGPKTRLTEAILHALQLKDFQQTLKRIYRDNMKARDIAGLSRVAYRIAEEGDEVARGIFVAAGDELAETAAAAIIRLNPGDENVLVSYQGAILNSCSIVRDRFCKALSQKAPNSIVVAPRYPPVIGAYLLGCAELGWELGTDSLKQLDFSSGLRLG